MPTETFNWLPSYSVSEERKYNVLISRGEAGTERRREKPGRQRTFKLSFNRMSIAQADALYAFYDYHKGPLTAFYWATPIENEWQAGILVGVGAYCFPTAPNGYRYECTTAGTAGGSEPTWPVTIGNTVSDNTVVWTCRKNEFLVRFKTDSLSREYFRVNRYRLDIDLIEVSA